MISKPNVIILEKLTSSREVTYPLQSRNLPSPEQELTFSRTVMQKPTFSRAGTYLFQDREQEPLENGFPATIAAGARTP